MTASQIKGRSVALDSIESQLLAINPEPSGEEFQREVFNDPDGSKILGSFCSHVLDVYLTNCKNFKGGWISVSGMEPGTFKPIVIKGICASNLGVAVKSVSREEAVLIAVQGHVALDDAEEIKCHKGLAFGPTVIVRLVSHGEYFGLMGLVTGEGGILDSQAWMPVVDSLDLLRRLLAETMFSKRLKSLVAPFEFSVDDPNKLYGEIAERAMKGLAADGSVLRLRRPNLAPDAPGYELAPLGSAGLLSGSEHLKFGSVFERVCRRVFDSAAFVTVQTLQDDNVFRGVGVKIPDSDNAQLRSFGIKSYMIMKLESDLKSEKSWPPLGTLSVFHKLNQTFSHRDISLFQGFCERVADDLTLLLQYNEQQELAKILQVHNSQSNRAELTVLMAHDFGHKIEHTKLSLQEFVGVCRKNWQDRQLPAAVQAGAEEIRKSCDGLENVVVQIRNLGRGLDIEPAKFFVIEVLNGVRDQLGTVLARNNMALDIRCSPGTWLFGAKGILLQALFNLVINSIDAQKSSRSRKRNTVHISCREIDGHRVEFSIWDEGPGISWSAFPNADRIFDIGATSKDPTVGTGTGLPTSRSLLSRFFGADLKLTERTNANFKFIIPMREPGKS